MLSITELSTKQKYKQMMGVEKLNNISDINKVINISQISGLLERLNNTLEMNLVLQNEVNIFSNIDTYNMLSNNISCNFIREKNKISNTRKLSVNTANINNGSINIINSTLTNVITGMTTFFLKTNNIASIDNNTVCIDAEYINLYSNNTLNNLGTGNILIASSKLINITTNIRN